MDDPEEVDCIVMDYFCKLFSSTTPSSFEVIFEGAPLRFLSQEQHNTLVAPFVEEKIKNALFMMHSSKALGLDGFHAAFYKKYWSIVGKDVTVYLYDF